MRTRKDAIVWETLIKWMLLLLFLTVVLFVFLVSSNSPLRKSIDATRNLIKDATPEEKGIPADLSETVKATVIESYALALREPKNRPCVSLLAVGDLPERHMVRFTRSGGSVSLQILNDVGQVVDTRAYTSKKVCGIYKRPASTKFIDAYLTKKKSGTPTGAVTDSTLELKQDAQENKDALPKQQGAGYAWTDATGSYDIVDDVAILQGGKLNIDGKTSTWMQAGSQRMIFYPSEAAVSCFIAEEDYNAPGCTTRGINLLGGGPLDSDCVDDIRASLPACDFGDAS